MGSAALWRLIPTHHGVARSLLEASATSIPCHRGSVRHQGRIVTAANIHDVNGIGHNHQNLATDFPATIRASFPKTRRAITEDVMQMNGFTYRGFRQMAPYPASEAKLQGPFDQGPTHQGFVSMTAFFLTEETNSGFRTDLGTPSRGDDRAPRPPRRKKAGFYADPTKDLAKPLH